jgi:hypothetical protein
VQARLCSRWRLVHRFRGCAYFRIGVERDLIWKTNNFVSLMPEAKNILLFAV